MYGTRELNHKRYKLLKEFKGKYFTDLEKRGLYKVTNVIVNLNTNAMRLVYVEVHVKHKCNSLAGQYQELVAQRDLYFDTIGGFKNNMNEITNKEDKFNIAYTAD